MGEKITMSEKVYMKLHSKIMNLNIKPGKNISIKDICESMNVSRSPARDAIIRLEEEGLVESIPQVGTRITKIDLKTMEDERYLRHCIEYKMYIDFLENDYLKPDLEKYEKIINLQMKAIEENDFISFLEYDNKFHEILFETTNRRFIWKVITDNQAHYGRIRLLSLASMGVEHLEELVEEHKEMVGFMEKRDKDSLIEVLNKHISELVEEKFWLKDNYPDLINMDNESKEKINRLEENSFLDEIIRKQNV
ncbi:GntR family transcriptional regulator [Miniphocaeibacter halophilus]|uniref:GntR family transcriptional regulator n=1 Tax=Miniphocaeibacter halophilus TaxID=2931922 RepID=A0AC61MXT3_9FIRM|nr:GntR family transcriptional regulator [Miniphocaeibacter halophilus]QQK08081.1 GntR family transcriptional regulator [Miniphocaeibacter halophilus]